MTKRKIGVKLGRSLIRVQRKLGDKEVIISKSPTGHLARKEAKEILNEMQVAKTEGILPGMTYTYNPEPFPWAKDIIVIRPKTGKASTLAPKVRAVVNSKFGTKYRVSLG